MQLQKMRQPRTYSSGQLPRNEFVGMPIHARVLSDSSLRPCLSSVVVIEGQRNTKVVAVCHLQLDNFSRNYVGIATEKMRQKKHRLITM